MWAESIPCGKKRQWSTPEATCDARALEHAVEGPRSSESNEGLAGPGKYQFYSMCDRKSLNILK